ncbi:MAG: diaminopimelate decarboxylase [Clostridiaceae bacterium]|jgi:diaminopimelate decarboxylase|nr:diaminopimelate decarboxylase [Clostridiaceae bacterium]
MKKPILTLEKAREIIKTYPTPFYVYDEKAIRQNIREYRDAWSWNKGFKEYFAVKANPNPVLIKILQEEGCGTDCSSYTELMLSEALGFKNKDIFFSSNETPAAEFKYAKKLGARINLDDFTHIKFLEECAGLPEEICLRFNPGDNFKISTAIMDHPEDAKYGFTFQQLVDGFKILKSKGVKRFGIHSFLASNCLNENYYPSLAGLLFKVAVELKESHGVEVSFFNLSGGIGIPYRPEDKKADVYKISAGVKKAYEEILLPAGMKDIQICTELGRYITGPYGELVVTAIHEKNIYKNYIGVDACAVNLMRPAMYRAYHHVSVLGKETAPADRIYDVVGSLCENNDKFAIDRSLPKINIGDILVLHDAGAHGYAMGYNYNGKLKCAELLLKENGDVELIRRKETPQDYFATIDFLNVFKK